MIKIMKNNNLSSPLNFQLISFDNNNNKKRIFVQKNKSIKTFNSKKKKKIPNKIIRKNMLKHKENIQIKNKAKFNNNIIKIILNFLIMTNSIKTLSTTSLCMSSHFSKIYLKVNGTGIKNILGYTEEFKFDPNFFPNEIHINGERQDNITYFYNFNQTDNFVELIWNNSVTNCRNMFRRCTDIYEFNFSEFETSQVTDMWCMFYWCTSLTSLNVSNFDTSKVLRMAGMFQGCKSLLSLNLSNFVTSQAIEMNTMFGDCVSLTSIDLSNFDTNKVNAIFYLFQNCFNLEYINIKNFNENSYNNYKEMFDEIPDNVVICVNENDISDKLLPQINNKTCHLIDCSDNWKSKQKKIINVTGLCINNCNENSLYKYEYNGRCYDNCTNGFFVDENNNLKCKCELEKCLLCRPIALKNNLCTKCNIDYYQIENDPSNLGEYINCYKDPAGYYLDTNDNFYKKCYYRCETCEIIGNNITHNCLKCNENFPFEFRVNNYVNCYENDSYFTSFITEMNDDTYLNDTKLLDYSTNEKYEPFYNSYPNTISNNIYHSYEFPELTSNSYKYSEYFDSTLITNKHPKSNLITYYPEYSQLNVIINKYPDSTLIKYNTYQESALIPYNYTDYFIGIGTSYVLINNENVTQRIIKTSHSQVIYEYNKGDSLSNNCNFKNINNNTEIFKIIADNIQSLYDPDDGKSQVIQGENGQIFQITNGKNELELLKGEFLNNQNLSILDLGNCETKLKKVYNLNDNDSLVYLKQDNINSKASEKNIQYEIYEPYNFTKLNLSICDDEAINLYVKIDLTGETKEIYEYMKSLGYDMLNINDPFYEDICTPYKYANNTDILLSDRKDYIYNNKDSQCQSNCEFNSYLSNSLYINCTCSVPEDKPEKEDKFTGKKIYESFYEIFKYSNIKVLKCYNLVFKNNNIKKNIGSIIILIIFSFYFSCLILYIIKGESPLENKIKIITSKALEKKESKIDLITKNNNIENKINQNSRNIQKILSHPVKKVFNKYLNSKKNNDNTKRKKQKIIKKIHKINYFHESLKPYFINNIPSSSKNVIEFSEKNANINKIENLHLKKEEEKVPLLDAYELNKLEYDKAICYDKRIFLKIYWDLISREHKIIFTFFICNDYNILYIKFARFIFLFATDMALNVFFFSDESMHKIFLNYGKYNFIQQIPQIIYTTIISQLIEVFLCFLSLTDKHIYDIKKLAQSHGKRVILKILKCIKIKLICFFIFTFIFFCFHWYTVASFCAVYENTQITFIKDSLLSFLLGIIYPFALYLIPSALRTFVLKHPKLNLKCIYKLSDVIPFF